MTLAKQYPIGSTVLNLSHHLGKVVGYRNEELVIEGIGEFAQVGKWLATPEKTTRLSNGHFGLADKYEYFVHGKDLYRAPFVNPIGQNGLRQGARAQMAIHLLDAEYLSLLGL